MWCSFGLVAVMACGDDASNSRPRTDTAVASDAVDTRDDTTVASEVEDDADTTSTPDSDGVELDTLDVALEVDVEVEVSARCGDGHPDPGEACDDGNDNDLDGCTRACTSGPVIRHPSAGEVVFSELMIDPSKVADPLGEWLELTNTASDELNLGGCVLRDDGTDLVALDPDGLDLRVAPGGLVVFGLAGDTTVNGGVVEGFVYTTMLLDNVADEVELVCDGVVIDRVQWTPFAWPVVAGRALALDPTRANASDNDLVGSWCLAERLYGAGDRGTPGATNPSCPQLDTAIDGCALLATGPLAGFAGAPVQVGVEVHEAGVTDATDGVDVLPTLVVEVGWGPTGASPEGLAWTWTRAQPAPDLTVAVGADGYRGPITVGSMGAVDVLARASRDGGASWRLCDRLGTLPAQPTTLNVATSPCTATSCRTPPSATCAADGVTLDGFEPSGMCTPTSASAFTCAYDEARTDCGASGLTCGGGACAGAAAVPVTGDIVFTEVMLAPTGGPSHQWLELESAADVPLALTDCVLEATDPDGFAPFTITQPTVIGRHGHLVVGASTDLVDNGGAPVQRAWGEAVVLGMSEGSLELRCGGETIDYFAWDAPLWPVQSGAALALSPYHDSVAGNDASTSWCAAQASFGAGDRGTPGVANPPCPGDVAPVTSCGFVGAIPAASPAGTTATQALRIVASGITNKTNKTDANPKLVMQTGVVARGAGAAAVSSWTSAAVDLAWQVPAGQGIDAAEDRYLARVRVPAPGSWDVFARATADGGNTWVVCDPTHPVALDPVASACDPDPCGAPPPRGCSAARDHVVVYAAPSECTLDDDGADDGVTCHFTETSGDDCGVAGAVCAAGVCTRFPRPPESGEVVLSELMIAPAPSTNELGEWIELQNITIDPMALDGCLLRSGGVDADEVWALPPAPAGQPLAHVIMPGAAAVVARSGVAGINGNSQPMAVWTNLGLANQADWVALECDGEVIDLVAWDVSDGWVVPTQQTLQLSGAHLDQHDDDFATSFCVPAAPTPRVPNLVCPAADSVLEGCKLELDQQASVSADAAVPLSVIVRDVGVTDLRPGPDPAYGTIVELGIGPLADAAQPLSSPAWTWLEAAPAATPTPLGWDRWATTWVPDMVTTVGVVARVSLDSGVTWTLCDRSGLGDGYMLDATITTSATACVPNPCHSSAPSTCSASTLIADADPGTCVEVDGVARCSYAPVSFSCTPFGGCSISGRCTSPPGAPSHLGDLVITEVMRDSTLPAPDRGEWLELTNPTSTPFDLRGCELSDGFGELVVVQKPVPDVINAGGWAVFAASTDKTLNGGVQPTSGALRTLLPMTLANVADTIIVTCGGVEIDRLTWSADWPGAVGQAMQLDRTKVTAQQNDQKSAWCAATATYGTLGNKGSPGLDNTLCP